MKKTAIFTMLFLTLSFVTAQEKKFSFKAEAQAVATTNKEIPFWMRSNTFGSIPSEGVSGSMILSAHKQIENSKLFDWGAGFEGRGNAGKNSKAILIEGYAKLKLSIFQITAGRTKDVMGFNGDSTLTSGNFSVSGNSLGVPKIEIAIPNYYTLPILGGLISIKGNLAHGWIGRIKILDSLKGPGSDAKAIPLYNTHPLTYFHQKSLYGRLGKQEWKLKIYGGINHQAFWGSERSIYGENFDLSPLETFYYVSVGKTYAGKNIPTSKIGNQIGSIDIGIEYSFDNLKMSVYRQSFYDVGALSKFANIADGLNGIALENQKESNSPFRWDKFLFEFFYSKNQAGETWSKYTKSGDEDYYNNFFYRQGWSYKSNGLGSPLITPSHTARPGQASSPTQYFINNRVVALHIGSSGTLYKYNYLLKISYSRNFGTFATSPTGTSTGSIRYEPLYGLFKEVGQFSSYLDVHRSLKNGFSAGATMAIDRGRLLYNSTGVCLKVSKSF